MHAVPDPTLRVGQADVWLGQGCHDASECHPEEYAWVRALACLPSDATTYLEAERLAEDAPLALVPLEPSPTGDPSCPFQAAGRAEFWMGVLDAPVDCVRGSILSTVGVLATRAACFSDL